MKKKIICLMTGLMVLMLTACGGEKTGTAASKEYVYRAEEVILDEVEDMNSVSDFYIKNGRMYFSSYRWEDTSNILTLVSRNMDGSDVKSIVLNQEDKSYSYVNVDEEGNYYGILNEYFIDDADPDNSIWRNDYYLFKMDTQGNEIWRQTLSINDDDYWLQWMQVLPDGRTILQDEEKISIYDKDGKSIKEIKYDNGEIVNTAYLLNDGSIILDSYDNETYKKFMKKLNADTGEISEEYEMPDGSSAYTIYTGDGYDFFMVGNEGIYGYNLGDEQLKKLMDFIDSDLSSNNIYNFSAISKKEFYGLINDDLTGTKMLMKFTKVEPEDVVDKTILTLGCNGVDWEVRNQIIKFNKANTDYRIRIEDYAQYNTEEDYSVGITKLNTDIASGKVPDILLLSREIPWESYVSKGLFEDLYPYIDKDEEIKGEDLFPNVLAAYETNGKMYHIIPKFTISTVAGKTSDVGVKRGWTLEEMNALIASKPEDVQAFAEATKSYMLEYSISVSGDQFIDWETGKCNFNSPGFISLLEFIKQFPDQLSDDYYNDSFFRSYDALWREGKVLLSMMYMDSFSSYNYMKKGTYGEDITLIGFPSEDRNGAAINTDLDMVMSSKSKAKDGAWQFMRYFLTDDYQKQIEYGWPLDMKQLDVLAEKAKQRPTYEDENGNIVEYDMTYLLGGVEVPITPLTDDEIAEVIAYIKSVDHIYSYNQSMINIISEEAAPFFEGQKSVKEVADIIQSRAQVYVNENR